MLQDVSLDSVMEGLNAYIMFAPYMTHLPNLAICRCMCLAYSKHNLYLPFVGGVIAYGRLIICERCHLNRLNLAYKSLLGNIQREHLNLLRTFANKLGIQTQRYTRPNSRKFYQKPYLSNPTIRTIIMETPSSYAQLDVYNSLRTFMSNMKTYIVNRRHASF